MAGAATCRAHCCAPCKPWRSCSPWSAGAVCGGRRSSGGLTTRFASTATRMPSPGTRASPGLWPARPRARAQTAAAAQPSCSPRRTAAGAARLSPGRARAAQPRAASAAAPSLPRPRPFKRPSNTRGNSLQGQRPQTAARLGEMGAGTGGGVAAAEGGPRAARFGGSSTWGAARVCQRGAQSQQRGRSAARTGGAGSSVEWGGAGGGE